mgnify:CR=1 FL=1
MARPTEINCVDCGGPHPVGPKGIVPKRCDGCNRLRRMACSKAWNAANPEAVRRHTERKKQAMTPEQRRIYKLRSLYGITPEEADAIIANGCKICGSFDRVVIDHCHTSGKVRDALCSRCNKMLGMAHDDASVLERAAEYIRHHAPEDPNMQPSRGSYAASRKIPWTPYADVAA